MPASIRSLSNDQLIKVYDDARKLQLDNDFIVLVKTEMKRRQMSEPEEVTANLNECNENIQNS